MFKHRHANNTPGGDSLSLKAKQKKNKKKKKKKNYKKKTKQQTNKHAISLEWCYFYIVKKKMHFTN